MGSDKVYTQAEVDGLMAKAEVHGVIKVQDAIAKAYNNQVSDVKVTEPFVIIAVLAKSSTDEERFHILAIPIPDCSGGKCGK